MTYAIVIAVFLVLPAVAAAARIAAYQRHGAHGRPDLESGHIRDFRPAHSLVHADHPSQRVQGDAPGPRDCTEARPATLRPVFSLGATPVPRGLSPWPSDMAIGEEFDSDTPGHRGRAA